MRDFLESALEGLQIVLIIAALGAVTYITLLAAEPVVHTWLTAAME